MFSKILTALFARNGVKAALDETDRLLRERDEIRSEPRRIYEKEIKKGWDSMSARYAVKLTNLRERGDSVSLIAASRMERCGLLLIARTAPTIENSWFRDLSTDQGKAGGSNGSYTASIDWSQIPTASKVSAAVVLKIDSADQF